MGIDPDLNLLNVHLFVLVLGSVMFQVLGLFQDDILKIVEVFLHVEVLILRV